MERVQVLKPLIHFNHTRNLKAQIYAHKKEKGGRNTAFHKGYHPKLYFLTIDVIGIIKLKEGIDMVMRGDNTEITVELIIRIFF